MTAPKAGRPALPPRNAPAQVRHRAGQRAGSRPHLLERLREIARRLRRARRLALFLDFDGTLTPLQRRPEGVRLGAPARRALGRLARHPRVSLWIVSGRRLADVRRRAGVKGVHYLGLHGWEVRPGQALPARTARLVRQARKLCGTAVADLRGVWIEDKGAVFVVHYRQAASADVPRARRSVRRIIAQFEPALRLLAGKKIWEVFPREVRGKGNAIREIARRQPAGTVVFFAGDDAADEEAFRALPRAVTVRVGRSRSTSAQYRLGGSSEVREFLEELGSVLG